MHLAVDFFLDHLRSGDTQFKTLAAHVLDQHGQMQLAATGHLELVGAVTRLHPQRHIVDQLPLQALLDVARGDVLALAAGEGGVVDLEGHADSGLVNRQGGHGLHQRGIAQGVGNIQALDAGNADDIARLGELDIEPLQPQVAHDLQHTALAGGARRIHHHHLGVGRELAAGNTANADYTHVTAVVQGTDLHLQGTVGIHRRRRHFLHHCLEQGLHVRRHFLMVEAGDALDGGGINHREIQLLLGGTEPVEQVEHLVHHPVRTRAGAVYLVDHHNGIEALLKGLGRYKAGLRHGSVHRVHQQQHRIHHGQHSLHLAAEVGVTGGVHDIDVVVIPLDRRVLGQDGDAALALLVIGIHDPLRPLGTAVQGTRLLQQAVHQGSLAMVHVGNNGDIAKLVDQGVTSGQRCPIRN